MMRISELAERSGVPATTLRFYESAGLLAADRTPAGYRVYDGDAVERLAFVGAAKHLGLSLEQIAELLAVWDAGSCAEVKADLRVRLTGRLDTTERRAGELRALAATLRTALEHLDALPDRVGPCDPECGYRGSDASTGTPAPLAAVHPPTPGTATERFAQGEPPERWRTEAVACSLTGAEQGGRTARWRELTAGAERTEIPDGMELRLPAERAAEVAALAVAEQRCCAFFDFRLHLDGPALRLRVRAPAEGSALLDELFGVPA